MVKRAKLSSPKSTGGGGYLYEDKVGAWFALHMLLGTTPLGVEFGRPKRIRFQASAEGWLLDDILVENGAAVPSRAAVSCKSAKAVKRDRLPSDFVEVCWRSALTPQPATFAAGRDLLVLATPVAPGTLAALDGLVRKARAAPMELAKEIAQPGFANKRERSFAASFATPAALVPLTAASGVSMGQVLASVRALAFDFESPTSESEARAIQLAVTATAEGTEDSARNLWSRLCEMARDKQPSVLTLQDVVAGCRGRVLLRAHPPFEPARAQLRRATDHWRDARRKRIGSVALSRAEAVDALSAKLAESRFVALSGASGSGKSVLAARLHERFATDGTAYAIDAASPMFQLPGGIAPEDLLAAEPGTRALLVVDSLEHATRDSLQKLAAIFRAIRGDGSPWRVLLVGQPDGILSAVRQLRGLDATPDVVPIIVPPPLTPAEWGQLRASIPAIAVLDSSVADGVGVNLKFLDVIAGSSSWDGARPMNEAEVADLFWTELVDLRQPPGDGPALEELGTQLANDRCFALLEAEVEAARLSTVHSLAARGLLFVRDGRVEFSHDLYADFARAHRITSLWALGRNVEAREVVSNPLWHRALRIACLLRLTRATEPSREWAALLDDLDRGELATNIALESIGLANDGGRLLRSLEAPLLADEGELMRRLLRRFVFASTDPHPNTWAAVSAHGSQPGDRVWFEAAMRIPRDLAAWSLVLRWARQRLPALVEVCPGELADIVDIWTASLPRAPAALRTELLAAVSPIAFTLGERLERPFCNPSDFRKQVSRCVLRCSGLEPERAVAFCRRMAGIDVPEEPPGPPPPAPAPGRPTPPMGRVMPPRQRSGPVPSIVEAPLRTADMSFVDVACRAAGAAEIADASLDEFVAILFACLLQPERDYVYDDMDRNVGMAYVDLAASPTPEFAPIRELLGRDMARGVEFVARLTEIATELWVEGRGGRVEVDGGLALAPSVPRATLVSETGTPIEYAGNSSLFTWHLVNGPGALTSVLMTFEKWLCEQLAGDNDSIEMLDRLLGRCRSVAMLGLLHDVGLRHPELLRGPLAPLWTSSHILYWSRSRLLERPWRHWLISSVVGGANQSLDALREWLESPHRQQELRALMVSALVESDFSSPFLGHARRAWAAQAAIIREDDPEGHRWLSALLTQTDATSFERDDEGRIWFVATPEPELAKAAEAAHEEAAQQAQLVRVGMAIQALLDGTVQLVPGQLDEWWEMLGPLPEEAGGIFETADLQAGFAACVLLLAPEWVNDESTRLATLREWVLPRVRPDDLWLADHRATSLAWSSMNTAAMGLGALLARSSKDRDLRRAVCLLVLERPAEVVASLVRGILSGATPDEPLVREVVDLVFLRTDRWGRTNERTGYLDPEPVADAWSRVLERPLESFADLAPRPDLHFLTGSLGALVTAGGDMASEVARCAAQRALRSLDPDKRPTLPETRVLRWVALEALGAGRSELAREWWEPWMCLEPRAEEFATEMLVQAHLASTGVPVDVAVELFRSMFAHALSPRGILSPKPGAYPPNGAARALVGYDGLGRLERSWTAGRGAFYEALSSEIEEWLGRTVGWHNCLEAWLAIVCSQAGEALRIPTVRWLASSIDAWRHTVTGEDRAEAERLTILEHFLTVVSDDESALSQPVIRESFELLLGPGLASGSRNSLAMSDHLRRMGRPRGDAH